MYSMQGNLNGKHLNEDYSIEEEKIMEDDLNERQPQWKTISKEDNINGRQPQWKMTRVYYFVIVGSAKNNSSTHSLKCVLASTIFWLCILEF